MKHDNSEELFPIVDCEGNVRGCASRGVCHGGSKLLHPVVHLHLINKYGEVYLQKRPEWKDIQPGKWDTAVGGHVDYGEETEEALYREVWEEIGLTRFSPEYIKSYVFESDREREYVNVYAAVSNEVPSPSDELEEGKFWSIAEIEASLGKGIFTPNFESEFAGVLKPWLVSCNS